MSVRRKHILLLAALVCCIQARVYALSSFSNLHSFIYLTPDSISQTPEFSDEEFDSLSTEVIFKVNSTEIRPDDKFFTVYRNEILPIVNRRHLQLRKIFIRGAASPEGPYDNNQRLSRGRSAALLYELKSGLAHQYLDAEVEVSSITEDYGNLCVMMKKAGDKDYDRVKAIYDGCGGNELRCKQLLMSYRNGQLWQRLLKEYYPKLRAARVILWFSEPDAAHTPWGDIERTEPPSPPLDLGMAQSFEPLQYPIFPTAPEYTRRHLIAIRTNLVHDFFYMPRFGMAFSPNIQLEYYPLKGHLTYNIGLTWGTNRRWSKQQFWQVRDFQFELRRYFKGGGRFRGLYLGAFVHGDIYGIGLDDQTGWEGEGGGAGLSVGYTMRLNRKGSLRLEFMAAVGFFFSFYDPYVYGNPITGTIDGDYYYDYLGNASSFKRRNHFLTWFGPTNFGIQLTYDIIYRKKQRIINP